MENNTLSSKGVHGVIADIIKTEKKYELAIKTATQIGRASCRERV